MRALNEDTKVFTYTYSLPNYIPIKLLLTDCNIKETFILSSGAMLVYPISYCNFSLDQGSAVDYSISRHCIHTILYI